MDCADGFYPLLCKEFRLYLDVMQMHVFCVNRRFDVTKIAVAIAALLPRLKERENEPRFNQN